MGIRPGAIESSRRPRPGRVLKPKLPGRFIDRPQGRLHGDESGTGEVQGGGCRRADRVIAPIALAQSRIRTMPGYDRWAEMAPQLNRALKSGAVSAVWAGDSRSFEYVLDARTWRFDIDTLTRTEVEPEAPRTAPCGQRSGGDGFGRPASFLPRGRGGDADVTSPDGRTTRLLARVQHVARANGRRGGKEARHPMAAKDARVRHGVGSYVYLEEFSVAQPVWWSPDGQKTRLDAL